MNNNKNCLVVTVVKDESRGFYSTIVLLGTPPSPIFGMVLLFFVCGLGGWGAYGNMGEILGGCRRGGGGRSYKV